MSRLIENRRFDFERALYNLSDAEVRNCIFAGPAGGEFVLNEAEKLTVRDTSFSLRYPMRHAREFRVIGSTFDIGAESALWYSENGEIADTVLSGSRAVRECACLTLRNCTVRSREFGWNCSEIRLEDSSADSEYLFFGSRNITLEKVQAAGKYAFQYAENLTGTDCTIDSEEALWHSRNTTLANCELKGDRFGWHSENLTLIGCRIIGKQPLCYCRNLKLVNCTMEGAESAFEYSDVDANIRGQIDSVRNPLSGMIIADSVGEIIKEKPVMECDCYVQIRGEGWNWSC